MVRKASPEALINYGAPGMIGFAMALMVAEGHD
jgi:hypothetical protein